MNESAFATGDIHGLVRKFAIPGVISMVVAALYNIVDQIYIGWSPAGPDGGTDCFRGNGFADCAAVHCRDHFRE